MDRGAWQATVHGVTKGWICLSVYTHTHTHTHTHSHTHTHTHTHTHSDFNVQQELKTTGEAEMFEGDSSERNWKVFLLVGRKQNYLNFLLLFLCFYM